MRITGGEAKGRPIAKLNGLSVRPTSSKIRQAFFNILQNKISGAVFLDLCAGSGLMGMEALSRGASELTAVEKESVMSKSIQKELLKLEYKGNVIRGSVQSVIPTLKQEHFDIIFADPPYKSQLSSEILLLIARHNILKANGILIIEHAAADKLPDKYDQLVLADYRKYGQTALSFFRNH